MMIRHSVGCVPRLTRRLALPSAHEIVLFAAGHPVLGTASGHGALTVVIAAPALHAGEYQITVASLSGGPVCLTEAALHHDDAAGTLTVTPGLWAADMVYGAPSVQAGWLADGAPLADTAATLTLGPHHTGQAIRHSETVVQGGLQVVALSAIFDVPGNGEPEPEPERGELALRTTSDATLEAELGSGQPVTITVTEPARHAGTYTMTPAALAQGPVCLIPPRLEGLAVAGHELQLTEGLWLHDLAAAPMQVTREWRRNGTAFAHAGTTLMLTEADRGQTITCVETAQDGHGAVIAATPARAIPHPGQLADSFTAPDGTLIGAYVGESGISWNAGGAKITNGRLHTDSSASYYTGVRNDDLPADQFAEGIFVIGSAPADDAIGLLARGTRETRTGYFLRRGSTSWVVGAISNGSVTGTVSVPMAHSAEEEVFGRIEVRGQSDLRVIVAGQTIYNQTHQTVISSGKPGFLLRGRRASGISTELTQFHAGALS